jgi:hypothetical protein
MPSREKLAEFVAWYGKQITGDETFRSGTASQIRDPWDVQNEIRQFMPRKKRS